MSKETFTTAEAAAVLGVSVGRVRQLVLEGTLKAEKFGRDLVIRAEGLEQARQRKTSRGPDPKPKAKTEKTGKTTHLPSPPGTVTAKEAILKGSKKRGKK
jgi:excisionase family DNA binding protein